MSRIIDIIGKGVHSILSGIGWLLILPIRFYQRFISPLTPPTCRFTPPCSNYAIQAIHKSFPLSLDSACLPIRSHAYEWT